MQSIDPLSEPHAHVDPRAQLEHGLRYERAGLLDQATSTYSEALALTSCPLELATVRVQLARLHQRACRWDAALQEVEAAAALAKSAGATDLVAEAMSTLAGVHTLRGDFATAWRVGKSAVDYAEDPRIRGTLFQILGSISAQRREFPLAERCFTASMGQFKAARYPIGVAIGLNNVSAAARDAGDPARALDLAVAAMEAATRIDALDTRIVTLQNKAHALLELGDFDASERAIEEALGHFSATHNTLRYGECHEILGRIHERRDGYDEESARCYRLALKAANDVDDSPLAQRVLQRLHEPMAA